MNSELYIIVTVALSKINIPNDVTSAKIANTLIDALIYGNCKCIANLYIIPKHKIIKDARIKKCSFNKLIIQLEKIK